MVYLLNSRYSENQPDSWLCGGVLISTTQVLTAAACLTEVSHIYVIAGYKKYVNGKDIQKDDCTRSKKQKIVRIIIPKAYNASTWIRFDIGLGVVEKPYDFFDTSYRKICSYEPDAISVNYNIKIEINNNSVFALGWGGSKARQPGIKGDLNSEFLMEAHTTITNKSLCLKQFSKSEHYYILCTDAISDGVKTTEDVRRYKFYQDECDLRGFSLNDSIPAECLDIEEVSLRKANGSNPDGIDDKNKTLNENKWDGNYKNSRKQGVQRKDVGGICQNDHGGPLVALVGQIEIVIGVSLNSVYNQNYQCRGPFLYLSTARCSVLIKCLISSINETRTLCESLNYEVKEYNVTWPEQNKETVSKGCQNGKCLAMVRMRPQMRLLDLITDVFEE